MSESGEDVFSISCNTETDAHNTTQHNTTQHNTTQHNTTQHNTTQQHNTTPHNTTHISGTLPPSLSNNLHQTRTRIGGVLGLDEHRSVGAPQQPRAQPNNAAAQKHFRWISSSPVSVAQCGVPDQPSPMRPLTYDQNPRVSEESNALSCRRK